jgi:hypothetical protein
MAAPYHPVLKPIMKIGKGAAKDSGVRASTPAVTPAAPARRLGWIMTCSAARARPYFTM